MKKIFLFSAISILILTITFSFLKKNNFEKENDEPSDWFLMQRAYPFNKVDYAAYKNALNEKAFMFPQNSLRDYLQWEPEGPINIGGRVQDIEMDPTNTSIIYVGSASGGIFKSKDAGTTWQPIFDAQTSLSIGDVAVCATNPDLIYAGTGEPNCGGGSVTYDGAGIFKSVDAGINWSHVGLDSTRNTGRIVIDPKNNNRVFAATMGDLFANGNQRGVYRTIDGGTTWKQVLFVSDSTGAIDLAINPEHPDTVYACMWERVRRFTYEKYYGSTCGIYRTYDGGDTWTHLTNGLPTTDIGRIGIDIAQSSPNVLYSIYTNNAGGIKAVYKTIDGGDTWTNIYTNTLNGMFASYGWWFSRIKVDPTNPDIAFAIGFDSYKTINGGTSWSLISSSMHVDHHTMYIHPLDHNLIYNGCDGGLYKSTNGGTSWTHFTNIPNNQFYTSEVDFNNPTNLYGGTQDNGVYRTTTGNIDDYKLIIGGDGFYVLVDPTDNNFIYGESQYGALSRSVNGGNSFIGATSGISNSARKNWNSPMAFNPQNPKSLYFGANKVYKTVNRAAHWDAISDDLTNGYVSSNVTYATITSIAASPIDSNIIWAGTDDGNVWVTENNGTLWTKVSDSLPLRWVTRVVCDIIDSHVAYVTFSGYKYFDNITHVYRTTDLGQTWQSVSGNMPDVPANDLIIDPILDSTLYLATDAGVFYTSNLGNEWFVLGYDLPSLAVTDLTFHEPTRKLIAATYGRSLYSIDLSAFTDVPATTSSTSFDVSIFPNPIKDQFTVNVSGMKNEAIQFSVFNLKGNLVWSKEMKNENHFRFSANEIFSQHQKGIYFLKIKSGNQEVVKRIIVL